MQSKIKQTLQAGSFVFRGQATAVSALDPDLLEGAKKLLADVAIQVFDRYIEAPVRAGPTQRKSSSRSQIPPRLAAVSTL